MNKRHVFIIGSKGIPACYGGFETFVDKLTGYSKKSSINYHVSCLIGQGTKTDKPYVHNNAHCFPLSVPNIGPTKAILYDIMSLCHCVSHIQRNDIKNATILILACRIGPFLHLFERKLRNLGVFLIVNPDGHEWKRAKWNVIIRKYWKFSERLMVKYADILSCDSVNIEKYIASEYTKYSPKTVFIPYGATVHEKSDAALPWLSERGLLSFGYYLIVARFEPENNFETIFREFIHSATDKPLVVIANAKPKVYARFKKKFNFEKDKRIRLVGTVYNQEMLTSIRQNAFAYIHGHEVGGTNPSLLEAMACTEVNLLLDCVFNREVGGDAVLYWSKTPGELSSLIDELETGTQVKRKELSSRCIHRIIDNYNWNSVVIKYEDLFAKKA